MIIPATINKELKWATAHDASFRLYASVLSPKRQMEVESCAHILQFLCIENKFTVTHFTFTGTAETDFAVKLWHANSPI